YSAEGLDQVRAARMAVDEINAAGGILGREVDIVVRDSSSDVLQTRFNVSELADLGCVMIFGGSSSAVAEEASDICQRRGVLFFATLAYSTSTTLEKAHRLAFRECSNSWMAAKVMADWLNERFAGRRYFYITADYTWGWTTEASLRQVTGSRDHNVHPGLLAPLGSVDFHLALERAAREAPDVLVLVLFGKDLALALAQAEAMGLGRSCQIVAPNLTLGIAERAGPRAMQGVVGTLPWYWKLPYIYDYPRGRRFVSDFFQRFRRCPSTAGASAYTIVYEYKSAVDRAGGFEAPGVVRALEGHSYRLLKDEQTWRAFDHQSIQTMYLVRGKPAGQVLQNPRWPECFEIILSRPGREIARSEQEWIAQRKRAGLLPRLEPLER
ncbi:MAG: ABC transporter substrate-binding protein, partial [Desulfovibrionaceae bacterium]|nr:ABC transporter substrate-binding protein [Desulfovibrionaceae bacterium]